MKFYLVREIFYMKICNCNKEHNVNNQVFIYYEQYLSQAFITNQKPDVNKMKSNVPIKL